MAKKPEHEVRMLTFLALCAGENGRPEIREAAKLIGTNHSLRDIESTFFLDEWTKVWGFENQKRGFRSIRKDVGEFLDHSETDWVTVLGVFVQEDIAHIEALALYCHQRAELLQLRRQQSQSEVTEGMIHLREEDIVVETNRS